jgi:hypothetical protein
MGVITSRPGSRQTSPDPLAAKATAAELVSVISHSETTTATAITSTGSHTSPLEAMVTSSDDDEHHHLSVSRGIEAQLSGVDAGFDNEDGILSGDLASQEQFSYSSRSDDEYESDSMGEIDVENIAMGDSDFELEHEGSPYIDVDPLCEDRMTAEEAEELLDDARMRGKRGMT